MVKQFLNVLGVLAVLGSSVTPAARHAASMASKAHEQIVLAVKDRVR
jgi:hypothetical protein